MIYAEGQVMSTGSRRTSHLLLHASIDESRIWPPQLMDKLKVSKELDNQRDWKTKHPSCSRAGEFQWQKVDMHEGHHHHEPCPSTHQSTKRSDDDDDDKDLIRGEQVV
jgi:hypothetical protein